MPSSEVMPKFARGTLRSSSGQKVTNPAQARAIASSEEAAEKANGGVYPEKMHPRTRPRKKAEDKIRKRVR